ncbi:MAG: head GIN domain-containing protein [Pseudonocardiaceae bacterium]
MRRTAVVLRGGAVVAGFVLLIGCGGTSLHRNDGAAGVDGAGGNGVVQSGDGADGADGADGESYSDGGPVTGSGRLTSRQLIFSGVSRLDVGATFTVRVTTGEPGQATIRMDDNLTDLVDATVVGDELRLGLKPGASVRNASLSAEVTVASLDRLTADGVSHVTLGSTISGEQLQFDVGGSSQVTGVVRVAQALASASGTSTLELSGNAGRLDLSGAGTSTMRMPELTVRDLDVELSGASCATVAVSDTLTARTSGASALRYSGAPRINQDETSGLSSIAPQSSGGKSCGV